MPVRLLIEWRRAVAVPTRKASLQRDTVHGARKGGLLCCPIAFALIVPAAAAIVPAITQGKANLLGSMYRLLT